MPPAKLAGLPTWLLSRANARSQAVLADAFAELDLRPIHFRTLSTLGEYDALSQADLGRLLHLDRKDVAVTLHELESRRLVDRSPDPADGRRNVVTLTDDGRDLLPRLERIVDDVQVQVLSPLTSAERTTLITILAKLS
ncbi:MAG TPA: MarR family transcriptional regulator [Nocardioides sp.]|uniref:MarR family winged helix-turn-helix transcriptional regulator n=1 Tax=Nocardioides sp. TaxID=35761 RepID=UPI002CD065D3|nr:MarR family transcriptional regulator [Nocardioides sp.]HTW14120.1 MarR family transcriptional regulator [Nocardioides sp.]